jgi:hypothetical protein
MDEAALDVPARLGLLPRSPHAAPDLMRSPASRTGPGGLRSRWASRPRDSRGSSFRAGSGSNCALGAGRGEVGEAVRAARAAGDGHRHIVVRPEIDDGAASARRTPDPNASRARILDPDDARREAATARSTTGNGRPLGEPRVVVRSEIDDGASSIRTPRAPLDVTPARVTIAHRGVRAYREAAPTTARIMPSLLVMIYSSPAASIANRRSDRPPGTRSAPGRCSAMPPRVWYAISLIGAIVR